MQVANAACLADAPKGSEGGELFDN
jgi:hypothetical protein